MYFIIQACVKEGYSSSLLGNTIKKINVANTKDKTSIYYSCAKVCRATEGCVAMTFKVNSDECWLKSATDHEPRKSRSFLLLECLNVPGHTLLAGNSENMFNQLDRSIEDDRPSCVNGYHDWVPSSKFCYKLIRDSFVRSMVRAQVSCDKQSRGRLALVDSKELNDAYAREMRNFKRKIYSMWTGWKFGKRCTKEDP